MKASIKFIAASLVTASTVLLPACGNMELLTKPAKQESVYNFSKPLPVTNIRYKTAIATDAVTESEVQQALLSALSDANSRNGYAQSWNEYYGAGSWAVQKSNVLRLDYRNMINRSTTHVTTDFGTQYSVDSPQSLAVTISPDNKLTMKEGFNLFGKIEPLKPYDSLEFMTSEIYKGIQWPQLSRTLAHKGTVTSTYNADSLLANFDRVLTVLDGSEKGLYKPEGFGHFYALDVAGQRQVIAVNFYPYRNGSRADFAYMEQYALLPDGSNSRIKGYTSKVSALLKKVAAD